MSPAATSEEGSRRVLLIEPYASGSHAAWSEGYERNSRHAVTRCALPGAFWRWRLRGAAPTIAALVDDHVRRDGRPDVVLVSSMIDLAQLLGFCRRSLGSTPVVLYLHENQIAFPRDDATDVDAALRCWTSLQVADHVVFNSEHHRETVLDAVPALAAYMPDLPHDLTPERLARRSSVVPVGVDVDRLRRLAAAAEDTPPSTPSFTTPAIVWPHRWDADKRPDVFVRALERLADDGLDYRAMLCGADSWHDDERRAAAAARLGSAVAFSGYADRAAYERLLVDADVVVSVADHEFFGVAVVEAIAAGCVPVLPNGRSYPELIPAEYHDAALYPEGQFRSRLAAVLADLPGHRARISGLAGAMARFDWSAVAPQLDALLDEVRRSSIAPE